MDEVFDLTTGDYISDKLDKFLMKRRNNYVAHEPENGKIKLTFTTEDNEHYSCIYFYKSKEEVYDMISRKNSIDIRSSYVKDFNIDEIISNYEEVYIESCLTSSSFWDGYVNFSGVIFDHGVDFYHTQFGNGDINFNNTEINSFYLNFERSTFGNGNISFKGAKFDDCKASFDFANFGNGNIDFSYARFGEVSFGDSIFGTGNINFEGLKVGDGDVNFWSVNFGKGNVNFNYSQFGKGDVNFNYSKFEDGNVSFRHAFFSSGLLSFFNTSFGKGFVAFNHAHFYNVEIDLSAASAERVFFESNKFTSHVNLKFSKIKELYIQNCIIEKTLNCKRFAQNKKLSFKSTINLGQIYLDWEDNNLFCAINRGTNIYIFDNIIEERPFTYEEKASQFRMLKENFHNIGYYDDEDAAYKAYMDCKTRSLSWFKDAFEKGKQKNFLKGAYKGLGSIIKKLFYKAFGLISGYGTKPLRILGCAVISIILCGFAYSPFVSKTFSFMSICKGLYFSTITFLTIGYENMKPISEFPAILSGIEGFIGLFLMSFFTVAVARKLLR